MRIFYLTEGLHTHGGHGVNLDHVEALRRIGYDARYLLMPDGAATMALPPGRDVPWQTGLGDVGAGDIVVVGEMHGSAARLVAGSPGRKIIHNQNPFFSFMAFPSLGVIRDWGCEGILAASGFTAATLRRMGWDGPLWTVRPRLDPVFVDGAGPRAALTVASMPRKRPADYSLVAGLVQSWRPGLGVRFRPIENRTRAEAAEILASSEVFLSMSLREGLGLPPLEAMAAGCVVVGFHGGGGLEYATAENGDWFEDHQRFELAETLVRRLDELAAGERFEARRQASRQTAATFSASRFEAELASAWGEIAGPP